MSKRHRYEHVHYAEQNANYKHFITKDYGALLDDKLEEKFVVTFEVLEKLKLSSASPSAPLKNNDFQIVQNYFLDFWTHVLSSKDIAVYQLLTRWSFGKGFVIMPISELAERVGVTRKTLKKSLKVLEENFFILQIHRTYLVDDEKKNNDAPALFILRDDVPLLDKWQVSTLPPYLKQEHDDYIKSMKESLSDSEQIEQLDNRGFVRDFMLRYCEPEGAVEKKIADIIEKHGMRKVAESYFAIDEEKNEAIQDILKEIVTKPSYDTYFANSVFLFDDNLLTVICNNDVSATSINNNAQLEKNLEKAIEEMNNKFGYRNYEKNFIAKTFASYYIAKQTRDSF